MKKIICVVLVVSMTVTSIVPCWAQSGSPLLTADLPAAECAARGQVLGSRHPAAGAFAIGVTSGFCLGLIGAGVAWTVQGPGNPPDSTLKRLGYSECREEFRTAYGRAAKSKKRGMALLGGLLGTAGLVAWYVNSASFSLE